MQDGKKFSKIVEAIADAETHTTGEIRVHVSKRWFERDPYRRAQKVFDRLGMGRTTLKNAVLLYVNLRRRKFAIYGDEGIHQSVGQRYWERIARELSQDLRGTHHENAIAMAVAKIGKALAENFPVDSTHLNHQELSNDVTSD
ncbi:MAG: TPM domain-containing protein [Bdellovibrionia bacterium]